MFTGSLEWDLPSLPITHKLLLLLHIDYLLMPPLKAGGIYLFVNQLRHPCSSQVNQLPCWVDHEFCFGVLGFCCPAPIHCPPSSAWCYPNKLWGTCSEFTTLLTVRTANRNLKDSLEMLLTMQYKHSDWASLEVCGYVHAGVVAWPSWFRKEHKEVIDSTKNIYPRVVKQLGSQNEILLW